MIRESLCMHLSNSSANGSAGRAYRFEGYASTFEDVHKLLTQGNDVACHCLAAQGGVNPSMTSPCSAPQSHERQLISGAVV